MTGTPKHFFKNCRNICFTVLYRFFYKMKFCGNPALSLSEPFSQQHLLILCVSVTYWQFLQYFKLFRYYYVCYSDMWSVTFFLFSLSLFFFFFCLFRAAPKAYSSQVRGQIGAVAAGLHHSHSNARSEWAMSATYTIAHGNVRSLTHRVRSGIKSESSCILVGFITSRPWWELPRDLFKINLLEYS